MSLINEMLRDLDKRKKQEQQSSTYNENPVMVSPKFLSQKPILLGGGVLFLVAAVWAVMTLIPERLPISSLSAGSQVGSTAGSEVVVEMKAVPVAIGSSGEEKQQPLVAAVDAARNSEALEVHDEIRILGLDVVEGDGTARLSLFFAQLPEYRLLQNGLGQAQVVVSFTNTQVGADFEIPKLAGGILQRVSLLPQKQALQLLVDLNKGAQVQSFQLVDDSDQGYRLLIDIVNTVEIAEKKQLQPTPEPQIEQHIVASKPETKLAEKPKVSKNKNVLSLDRQAYSAGLKSVEQENWTSAADRFSQALDLNPDLLDARLRLVGVLQLQQKLDKAEIVLQAGLQLNPDNSSLRKLYARMMLNDQRYSEAINLLQAEPVPMIAKDLEYHALRAALFQESKQFESSRQVYGQLVQVRPQEALWWMGMAISLEQLGHLEQARSAYQKASNGQGLRPELQNYIQSRLQVL